MYKRQAAVIQFGEVCNQCALPRLERCFAENEQNRFFRNVSAPEWLSLRRRFARLAAAETVRFVVPAPAVARHWQILVPEPVSYTHLDVYKRQVLLPVVPVEQS